MYRKGFFFNIIKSCRDCSGTLETFRAIWRFSPLFPVEVAVTALCSSIVDTINQNIFWFTTFKRQSSDCDHKCLSVF